MRSVFFELENVGEYGHDLNRGSGGYYVKLYDGSREIFLGFDSELEAREEFESIVIRKMESEDLDCDESELMRFLNREYLWS